MFCGRCRVVGETQDPGAFEAAGVGEGVHDCPERDHGDASEAGRGTEAERGDQPASGRADEHDRRVGGDSAHQGVDGCGGACLLLVSPPAACEQDHDDERVDSLDESGSHLREEPAERSLSPLSRL